MLNTRFVLNFKIKKKIKNNKRTIYPKVFFSPYFFLITQYIEQQFVKQNVKVFFFNLKTERIIFGEIMGGTSKTNRSLYSENQKTADLQNRWRHI